MWEKEVVAHRSGMDAAVYCPTATQAAAPRDPGKQYTRFMHACTSKQFICDFLYTILRWKFPIYTVLRWKFPKI